MRRSQTAPESTSHHGRVTIGTDLEQRTYFRRFENALADFAPAVEAVPTILETVRGLSFTHVYIPDNRAFIGLEPDDGGEAIAYIMREFIALHPRDGVSSFVELPQPAPVEAEVAEVAADEAPAGAASGSTRATRPSSAKAAKSGKAAKPVEAEPEPAMCMSCFTRLPATGRCDFCD